ncbi:apolipoprotein Ea [Cheilinus undulatus]|uniref:apolipoprotein Ea n=1 Tax=Cheilinus undulatus TaxID=241271 RepID=UPI001BD5607D|nr:apolipoprotein Ea [Cheilinus undulatus]
MRAVIFFVLAVLSGCHARSFFQDEPKSPWEVAVDNFNAYFEALSTRADGVVKDIRSHEISRELDTLIQDSMSELSMYKDDLQIKLAPFAQEAGERLGTDLAQMIQKLRDHMLEAREQMGKYSLELQTMMEQNVDDVSVRVNAYTRKLKKRLSKDTQEIKRHVDDYVEELQTRTSENMEVMRQRADPYFAQVRDNAQVKFTSLNNLMTSQMEAVKVKLQTTAEDIKERLEETTEDLKSTMEEKMTALGLWLQPFVNMFNGDQ